MLKISTNGFLVSVDGPNGVGKSTLIESVKTRLEFRGYATYTTKEPTNTECGSFVRKFAENHSGISLACLVAADRYEHIENEILPELKKGKIVITDRLLSHFSLSPLLCLIKKKKKKLNSFLPTVK